MINKSYVGAGAYRSVSTLSKPAQRVLRRNLMLQREARISGEPYRTGFGSSPQQRKSDILRAAYAGKGGKALDEQMEMARKTIPHWRRTSVPNMNVDDSMRPGVQRMLERQFKGRKLKNPVTISTTSEDMAIGGQQLGGFAQDAAGGRAKNVFLGPTSRGFNPRMAEHEMRHAQAGKRKGRIQSLTLRKFPNRSLQNEEAAADAASFTRPGQRRVASGYSDMWGNQSQYGRELRRRLGYTPKHQSTRANINEGLRAAEKHTGVSLRGADKQEAKQEMIPMLKDMIPELRERGMVGHPTYKTMQRGQKKVMSDAAFMGRKMQTRNRQRFFRE